MLVALRKGIIETNVFIKSKRSHYYLEASSYLPLQCSKDIPNSRALRLNRSHIVRKENFTGKKCLELFFCVKKQESDLKITLNVTYDPVYRNLKNILQELHVILACDDEH